MKMVEVMKLVKKSVLMFGIVVLLPLMAAGQICSEILGQAEDEYQIGHLYAIPAILEGCLKSGFSKEEKIKAYRLLTLSYLYTDQPDKADISYLNLLKLSPEFEPNALTDPIELFYLHDNFITTPFFSLYLVRIGSNRSQPKITQNFNIDGLGSEASLFFIQNEGETIIRDYQHNYKSSWGFNIGTGIEYGFSQRYSIGMDINLTYQRYSSNENLLGGIARTGFSEGQWWIDLPLYFKYNFPDSKYKPYFLTGFQTHYLINTSSSDLRSVWQQDQTDIPQEEFVDFSDQRRDINFSLLVGAGAKYKVGINYLAFEVRYHYGLINLSINDQRFADTSSARDPNTNLMYSALHVDNAFFMNSLNFTVSYIKPIYKPRKKK